MSIKTVPAIIFAFVVGGLVGYGLSTGQALTAVTALADAVPALADAVPIPDAHQGEITSSTPIPPRPLNDTGTPASPTATPTRTHTAEPPVTLATESPEATKTPTSPLIEPSPMMRKHRKHHGTVDDYAHAQYANMHQSDTNERRRKGDTVNLKTRPASGTTSMA